MEGRRTLDHVKAWSATRRILDRFSTALLAEAAIDDCLDVLVDALGADRGLLLLPFGDQGEIVVNARGEGRALTSEEREETSRTIVRTVREQDRAQLVMPLRGGAASASMNTLGIVAAVAAPLRTPGGGSCGVLYVDFRGFDVEVGALHVELLESAGVLLGAVIAQRERLARTREALRDARATPPDRPSLDDLLRPDSMAAIRRDVVAALNGKTPVLVLGPSGTGKTLLAHAMAEASPRRPIVRAMLGTSDDLNTVTSELFGHERGSYSGAIGKRVGLVEMADGGTLILDELLNLSANAQKLLLDFAQFHTFRPLGWDRAQPKSADVRIIGATNGDLEVAIADGRFREDLYYRLAGVTVHLPTLRERREDVPAIAEAHLRRLDPTGRWSLSVALRKRLLGSDLEWPGNVRQLERLVQRAYDRARIEGADNVVDLMHLDSRDYGRGPSLSPLATSPPPPTVDRWRAFVSERELLETNERELLRALLTEHDGNVSRVARAVELPRSTLVSRLETLGIDARRRTF